MLGVVEAWLRERDAAARQRIEALWDRQAITGFPEEFYNRALGDVLEALGGSDERQGISTGVWAAPAGGVSTLLPPARGGWELQVEGLLDREGEVVPRSLLGLWAFLMVASSVMFCVGLLVAFLVDYLYLSGGHW